MKYYSYVGKFAGADLHFRFRYEETVKYFGGWLKAEEKSDSPSVFVRQQDFDDQKKKWNLDETPYVENLLSVYRASDELLKENRCIFHGAAFLWHDKAFLFTAPSGTGKSTQLMHWVHSYGNEIQIMNGDKPLLYAETDDVVVCPSPWKGKEGLGNDALTAPLGGIIILEQGSVNHIEKLKPAKSVPQLLQRILFTVETEELVLNACKMIEKIVRTVPVWKLVNIGDLQSAQLTYETIRKELNL